MNWATQKKIVQKAFPDVVFFGQVAVSTRNVPGKPLLNPVYVTGDIFKVTVVDKGHYIDASFFKPNSNDVIQFKEFCSTFRDMQEFVYYWDILDRRVLVEKYIGQEKLRF